MRLERLLFGTVGRGAYAAWGVALFALKHNLDRMVARAHGRGWEPFNYLVPPAHGLELSRLTPDERSFYLALLLLALPFVAVGVLLTQARLRSAALPAWLGLLFFVPVVNLFFFLLLCLVPEKPQRPAPEGVRSTLLDRIVPRRALGSAAAALLVSVPLGLASLLLGLEVFEHYGWGVFVGLPFALGLISALLYGYHEPRSLASSLGVATISPLLLGAVLLAFAVEGLVCIVMAAPLYLFLSLLGGLVGFVLQSRRPRLAAAGALLGLACAAPVLMGAEAVSAPRSPLREVRTTIEIDAPADRVWRNVVAFSELPPPEEWLFRAGIAYPVRATIQGHGPGAIRHCVFSTGAFVEPIEVWDAPRRLAFSVVSQPAPMQEWTPYHDVHPAHLDYFRSERGQFLLTRLPSGRTRLEGSTWYRHEIWPVVYWAPWSDAIIHRIHLRVLRHIERQSERAAAPAA